MAVASQSAPAPAQLFAPPPAPAAVTNATSAAPATEITAATPTGQALPDQTQSPVEQSTSFETSSPVEPATPEEMQLDAPRPKMLEAGQVIARVNGEVILACEVMWMANVELEHRLATLPAEQRAQIPPDQLQKVREVMMRQLLLSVIDRKIKYTDFRRKAPQADLGNIHATLDVPFEEKEIPRLLKAFKAQNVQDLDATLHAVGTSLREQREMFYEQMIGHSWIREQLNIDETVTHEDMLAYYQEHLADYEFPTQVRWEELMIRPDRCEGANWEERKANAYRTLAELGNEAWKRAQTTPPAEQAFVELAKMHSHGLTAADGGVHGWTTQGALRSTAINDAIFSLAPGQMSEDILRTDEGFHIVRVLERKDAGRTPFTEVQSDITEKVVDQRTNAAGKEKIEKIRDEARVWTIYDGHISAAALFTRPKDAARR